MNLQMSCFGTKLHGNMFQFRVDFLKQFSVQEEFRICGMNMTRGTQRAWAAWRMQREARDAFLKDGANNKTRSDG